MKKKQYSQSILRFLSLFMLTVCMVLGASLAVFAAGEVKITTNLTDNFTMRSERRNVAVWARQDGNKVDTTAVLSKEDGTKVKDLEGAWNDSVQQSFVLDMSGCEDGTYVITITDNSGSASISYTFTYKSAQDGEWIGQAVFSVEAFTISQGYIVEPQLVDIYKGENAAKVLDRVLTQNGYTYERTGTLESSFYLSTIKGVNLDPDTIELDETVATIDSVKSAFDPSGYSEENGEYLLGEFDFCYMSGWMYCYNNVFPNVGYADTYLNDQDVVRTQFTVDYGGDIGGSNSMGGGYDDVYKVANKDNLTSLVATINSADNRSTLMKNSAISNAFDGAYTVLERIGSSQEEVDAAYKTLGDALAAAGTSEEDKNIEITLDDSLTIDMAAEGWEDLAKIHYSYACKSMVSAKDLSVDSSDKDVATASLDRENRKILLKIYKNGETDITLNVKGTTKSIHVTVLNKKPLPESLVLTADGKEVTEGTLNHYKNTPATIQLTAQPTPADSWDYITWTSDKPGVATVSENGLVTTVNKGTAVITAAYDNGVTASYTLTVKKPATSISFNGVGSSGKSLTRLTSTWMYIGTDPYDTSDELTYTYSIQDPSIAEILEKDDEDAKVRINPVKVGTTELTATCNERPELTVTVKLNVSIGNNEKKAIKVMDSINALGTVTLDKKADVVAARTAYNKLSAASKAFVTEEALKTLTDAEAEITRLETAKAAADEVTAKITALGTVSLDSKNAVAEARNAYEALDATAKTFVTEDTLKVLTDAEAEITRLETAKAAADAVTVQITALGNVSLDSKDAVVAARGAYDALTDEEKTFVSEETVKVLTDAETEIIRLEAVKAKADAVSVQMKSIGTVTLDSKDAIMAARGAYDALTDEEKGFVAEDALAALTEAETAYKALVDADETEKARVEAVKQKAGVVAAQIQALGDVTLDSKTAVEAARKAYDTLTAEEKYYVPAEVVKLLTGAETSITTQEKTKEAKDQADAAMEKIKAIGSVSLDSKEAIDAARATYDSLSDEAKAMVPAETLKTLTDAEKTYTAKKDEAAAEETRVNNVKSQANAVIDQINGIGKVTSKSGSKVKAARKAYDALSDEAKSYVDQSKVNILTKAESSYTKAYAAAQKKKAQRYFKLNVSGRVNMTVKKSTSKIKASKLLTGDKITSWKSSNPKIVKVSSKGTFKPVRAGKATITVTTKFGAVQKFTVVVQKSAVKTESFKMKENTVTVKKGGKVKLIVVRNPITANDRITFTSSNTKIAVVKADGNVYGKKKGTCKILVKASNGKKRTVKVVVK